MTSRSSELVWFEDITEKPVEWVIEGWLARRTITLVDGDPGVNKSAFVYDTAALVTQLGGVAVLLIAEDDLEAVAKPRLRAAGAILSRIAVLRAKRDEQGNSYAITIPDDLARLRQAVAEARRRHDPNLVFIGVDPIVAYLDSKATNSWKDQDVRRALEPLLRLCAEENATCIVTRHFMKDSGRSLLHRGGGSIGFQGLVRLSCGIVLDPDDDEPDPNKRRRLLVSVKSNVGPKPRSRLFHVEPVSYDVIDADGGVDIIDTFKLVWDGDSEQTAESLMSAASASGGVPKKEIACWFLKGLLANGPMSAVAIEGKAKAMVNVSKSTLERAAKELGIKKKRLGSARGGTQEWFWALNYQQFGTLDDGALVETSWSGQVKDVDGQPDFESTRPDHVSNQGDGGPKERSAADEADLSETDLLSPEEMDAALEALVLAEWNAEPTE